MTELRTYTISTRTTRSAVWSAPQTLTAYDFFCHLTEAPNGAQILSHDEDPTAPRIATKVNGAFTPGDILQ